MKNGPEVFTTFRLQRLGRGVECGRRTVSREPGSGTWEPAECTGLMCPGCQGLRTGQPVSPRALQALGQLEETGLGVRTLDIFFPALLLSCDQVLHPPKPSFPYLLRRGDESSSEKYVAFFTNWGASSKVDDPGDETLLEVPPLVVWVGFRIKSLVLRLCLCPLSPPVPLSVFSPHQASTPLVRWGQQ